MLPVMGAGVVTWAGASAGGLPFLELRACVLPCLVMPLSVVESWKGALSPPTRMQNLGLR